MAAIPELLDGHVTLEVECLDRLYLNGYIGKLATGGGLVAFMRGQLEKPVPSPVVLGQVCWSPPATAAHTPLVLACCGFRDPLHPLAARRSTFGDNWFADQVPHRQHTRGPRSSV